MHLNWPTKVLLNPPRPASKEGRTAASAVLLLVREPIKKSLRSIYRQEGDKHAGFKAAGVEVELDTGKSEICLLLWQCRSFQLNWSRHRSLQLNSSLTELYTVPAESAKTPEAVPPVGIALANDFYHFYRSASVPYYLSNASYHS